MDGRPATESSGRWTTLLSVGQQHIGRGGSQDDFSVLLLPLPSLVAQECSSSKLTSYPGCLEVHVTSAGDSSGGSSNYTGRTLLSLTPNRENPHSSTSLIWVTVPLVEIQLL